MRLLVLSNNARKAKAAGSSTSSSSTSTKPKTTTSSSSSTTVNYNTLLAKFNDYALKADLEQYVKASDLPTGNESSDDAALNALIQKLIDYDIFKYDGNGKKVIVTEFFPGLISKDGTTYADGKISYRPNEDLRVWCAAYNIDLFDYLLIKEDNNTPINQSTYKHYFTKSADISEYGYISSAIVNEPIVTQAAGSNIKTITLILDGDGLANALVTNSPQDPSDAQELVRLMGPTTIPVEFIPTSSNEYIKNRIKCHFVGQVVGTGVVGIHGTITLTMPENVTLINPIANTVINPQTYSISVSGNVITVDVSGGTGSIIGGTYLTKQIIIAESATKRYVIKLNGEAAAPPPNY